MDTTLKLYVEETAKKYKIIGTAVGIFYKDKVEDFANYGVTNLENPLPVNKNTIFLLGSISKTYTATAIMYLVAEGKIELETPVLQYVPELKLKNEEFTKKITIQHLLNHTSGLDWRVDVDSGEGDNALEVEVAKFAGLKLIAAPGERTSYSQAGFDLLGRVIEKVTGKTFEKAMHSIIFEPLNLKETFYNRDDVMTRRFAVGHNADEQGNIKIARPWKHWRSDNPGGGISSSVEDCINWIKFHLGENLKNGKEVVPIKYLELMRKQTSELKGSSLGYGIGLCWFLGNINGVENISHGGSSNGQFAEILIIPEKKFGIICVSNINPTGIPFNQEVIKWSLKNYLNIEEAKPVIQAFDKKIAEKLVGSYQNDFMIATINLNKEKLLIEIKIKPEIRATATSDPPPDVPPAELGLIEGNKNEYLIFEGALKGSRGFYTLENETITGIDLAGRLFSRV